MHEHVLGRNSSKFARFFQCGCYITVHVMYRYMNVHIDWHAAKSNFEVGPYRTRFPREFALLHCHMWARRALEIQAETAMHMSMHMFKSMRFQ